MTDQFLILGVEPNAPVSSIDEAFRYLSRNLNATNFSAGSRGESLAQRCMVKILSAYQILRDPESRELARKESLEEQSRPYNPESMKPFLGHICVAAGIIKLEDLEDAISKQSDIDLPLGQILQEKQLLSQTELDGLLMGQRLFGAPARPLDRFILRLLAMSAVNRDMVKIVLIDQRTNFTATMPELLVKRGWLDDKVLQVLLDQAKDQASLPNSQ